MALNVFGRLSRFLRSIFVPAALIFSFSTLLSFLFILYKPGFGPGDIQRVGWQAWDAVSAASAAAASNAGAAVDEQVGTGGTSTGTGEAGVDPDWWNVSAQTGAGADAASLPLDVWAPLLQHDTGLTEITVERCMWALPFIDLCTPKSTDAEDAVKGRWVRVDRDLNMQAGMWHLFIYYRRTRRLDVPLITNIKLLDATAPEPVSTDAHHSWHKVERSVRDGIVRAPAVYLYYETGPPASDLLDDADAKQALVTELDLLYGEGPPWFGFERAEGPPTMEANTDRLPVYLTFRRGTKPAPKAPPLHFTSDGRFKILQVADLHFSSGPGVCRDPASPCSGGAYALTSSLLGTTLDAEKPDLVVFSGDQLNGQGSVLDAKSVLAKFAVEVAQRGIPWAAVFGNHDSEDARSYTGSRRDQIRLMQGLPYALVQAGPEDVHGVGNYVLKVHSADASRTQLLTLYFLDSGAYAGGGEWWRFSRTEDFDWVHEDQVQWFLQESATIAPIERPFTPDGASDLGKIWARQGEGQVGPGTKRIAKPNALMFFHIPLPEAYHAPDTDPHTGRPLDMGLSGLEAPGSSKTNGGLFADGILRALERGHRGARDAPEVKVVGNGHCHITENCRRVSGVWMCFGGGGSFEGYGKVGFDRRFRVYEIEDFGETIRTHKRTESGEIVDEMVLAGKGAPEMPW